MKTVKTTRVFSETHKLQFGYWDIEAEEFIPVESPQDVEKAAELLGCTPALIDCLMMLTGNIAQTVHDDLVDIWSRLDRMEGQK